MWGQAEKVLKALFVRKLYLWPRFEAQVKQVLERSDADIEVPPHLNVACPAAALPQHVYPALQCEPQLLGILPYCVNPEH